MGADFEAINAAIGRMIASVPESQTMDVYNAFSALVPAEVPQYLMSTVNEADAKRAYSALMAFKDVVKANPITPQVKETPTALSGKLGAIDAAAAKLSAASLGKVIASVPSSQVMDVFNAFSKITGPQVPSNLFSMVSPSEATAAYDAFIKFKDVVKAAQR